MIVCKKKNVFEKYDKEYFVLANLNYNAVFMFEKDVKIVWDEMNNEIELKDLINKLHEKGYSVTLEEMRALVETLTKAGLIYNDQMIEDKEFILENNAYQSYIDRCSSNNLPSILHLELTNRCNLKCIHCYHDEEFQELELEDIEHVFQSIKNTSFIRVTLTGGEIFTYMYWKEVVVKARQYGLFVCILSNITLLEESDIDFLNKNKIMFIRTSLYGATEATHDLICKVPGAFFKTYNNILSLKKEGVEVCVSCTIMKQNVGEIGILKEMMEKIGVDISFDYKIIPSRKETKDVQRLLITPEQFKCLEESGLVKRSHKAKCNPGTYRIAISNSGEIYGCDLLRISLGNIKRDNLMDVLNGEKMNELKLECNKYQPLECKTCRYEKYCTPCPGLAWNNNRYANVHHPLQCIYSKISWDSQ